jgi:Kdo2-lipid IVA lauroyltransferase/acyltransferase
VLVHDPENLVVAPFFRFLSSLSSPTATRLGAWLGVLAFHLGIRRQLVRETLSLTLGLQGPLRARVARRAYATMGANFLEIWTAGGPDGIERHIEVANPTWARALQARHPSMVMATVHLGSWDAALIGGRPLFSCLLAYAKAQHNALLDKRLNECRQITGAEILLTRQGDRTGAVTVMRALRSGGVVGLLADQRPRKEEADAGTFLGQHAWCHPGAAFFAQRARAVVVPGFALRVRSGLTRVYVLRPFHVEGLSPEAATQRVMDVLSASIAAFPGQYFWHHRRFSDVPDAAPAADPRWRSGLAFLRQL